MDFKFNSIGWVGGIYQKFETLCHEVDNIVNQDTVKYVENQAQSVGKSVKRFYSDVIHEILPPLKHEGLGVALKRSATIDTYVKPKAAIEEDHIDTVGKLSHVEPVAVDPIEKQLDHASNELCLSNLLSTPTSGDALNGAKSDIMSGQVNDVLKNTSSDVNIEENTIMEKTSGSDVLELISPSEEESFGDSLANEFIDCNNKNSCRFVGEVSLTKSFHDMEFQSPEKEGTVNNIAVDEVKKQLDCAFGELCLVDQPNNSNSVDSLLGKEHLTSEQVADVLKDTKPEVNIEENATMEKPSASEVSEFISPVVKESCGSSLLNEFIDYNDKERFWVEAEVSPVTSVHDVRRPSASDVSDLISPCEEESFRASLVPEFVDCNDKSPRVVCTDVSPATLVHGNQNSETVKNDFTDDSECVPDASGGITSSKMTSSVICCEENMAEIGVDSSCGSIFNEFYLPENSSAKAFLYHDSVHVAELVSHNVHSSSMLTPLLSNEKKLTGAVSMSSNSDLSLELLENDASRTVNGTESLTAISGIKNVYFGGESAQLQALSSSDIGPIDDSTDDICVSSMETIELCDEVKLEDSCVIVDSTALYAVSRIMRKHRSYKKRVQDALTSKKRLTKEYEQLAIWFGDADMGSNQDHLQTLRPSSSTTTLECKNLQTELVCDSEWELL
ncbi:uncharacterized protein LOC111275880 [Durio zibethinus]|uniref:Uncharacterized protein LOC111275880 n=1 Tax=Durio zibethinus TaxID=66656 RepID=A0A6P5WMJ2_DURZI|nr:uncharacterized protein LOC111275880 [Durio zibethinus]